MRKAKTGVRKSPASGKGAAKSAAKNVDEYLAGVPEPARGTLKKVRAAIQFDCAGGSD